MDSEYKAGEELDLLIADMLGEFQEISYCKYGDVYIRLLWHPEDDPPRGDDFQPLPDGRYCAWNAIPRYSTDISAAWAVVEWITQIAQTPSGANTRFAHWWEKAHLWADTAKDAALAICLAALKCYNP